MTGFLALFVGLLAAGMPAFLVLGLCAGAMFNPGSRWWVSRSS